MDQDQQNESSQGGFLGGLGSFLPILLMLGAAIMFLPKLLSGGGLGGIFDGIKNLFGGGNNTPQTPEQAAPVSTPVVQSPSTTVTNAIDNTQTPANVTTAVANTANPQPQTQPASLPALSYDRIDANTQWLNPEDYKGRITIPEHVIQEARQRGEKGVYALVAIKAGQREDGRPYVLGFHVFQDMEGKQTLIPMMSGGSQEVTAANWSNADVVESARNAPLPGLLTDSSGKSGDGLNAARTITAYTATPTSNVINGVRRDFNFFMELEDGKTGRSDIGAHNDFRDAGEQNSPWGSQGCPVVQPQHVALFQQELARLGIGQGSKYYILSRDETVSPTNLSNNTMLASNDSQVSPPLPTPQQQQPAQRATI